MSTDDLADERHKNLTGALKGVEKSITALSAKMDEVLFHSPNGLEPRLRKLENLKYIIVGAGTVMGILIGYAVRFYSE